MNTVKKTISILAIIAIMCTIIPIAAYADGNCGEAVSWSLSDDGVLTVSGAGPMADFEKGDAPWYANRADIRKLVIDDGVTSIGSAAFSGCGLISEIIIPLSIRSIGDGAFDDVYALENIYYAGSIAQWKDIDIGLGNSFGDAQLILADETEPFSDISGWYHNYIISCYMADIVNGFGDGTFRPDSKVTRVQFVMMLYNMGGRPEVKNAVLGFKDSSSIADVYMSAVNWGVKAGIIKGFDDNTFRPNDNISRAQMATFAYRFLKLGVSETTLSGAKSQNSFHDSASIAECYEEAVNVMSGIGVIQGYTDGNFKPNDTATRGQSATVMARLLVALTELRG